MKTLTTALQQQNIQIMCDFNVNFNLKNDTRFALSGIVESSGVSK